MRFYPAPSDEGPNEKESATATDCGKARHQKPTQVDLALEGRGEAPRVERSGEAGPAVVGKYAQAGAAVTWCADLNFSNRRIRTRTYGGVGGDRRV